MKWINGLTEEERFKIRELERDKLRKWHKWFAWYPVTVGEENGHKVKMWLCYIERKIVFLMVDYYVVDCYKEHTYKKYREINYEK